jgi:hypothetical protein
MASALMLLGLVANVAFGSAQTAPSTPGSGLQISPTRHELTIEPGTKQDITISLKNISGADVVANAVVNDFEADNRTGEPKLNVDPNSSSPASIKKFISNLENVQLAKDQSKDLVIHVDIPSGTSPGGYYGVIRYQAVPVETAENQGNVSLTASVGAIVLVQVPGQITESMQLVSLKAQQDDKQKSFFTSVPNKLSLEVKNTGNSFLKPFGKVTVTNLSGKEVASYEVNSTEPRGNVLPDTSRIFTNDIQGLGSFGRFKATANIGYGEGSEVMTISTTFWVIPVWLVIALAVFVVIVLGGIALLTRRLKRKKVKREN